MEDFGSVKMNLFPQCIPFSKVVLLLNVNAMLTFGKLIFSTRKKPKDNKVSTILSVDHTKYYHFFLLPNFFPGGQVKFIQLKSELPPTVKRKFTLR